MGREVLEHTGVVAQWCDICGACTCVRPTDGDEFDEDPACPLHSDESMHGEPVDHEHAFAEGWARDGSSHYHRCTTAFCERVLVGEGSTCKANAPHRRASLLSDALASENQ